VRPRDVCMEGVAGQFYSSCGRLLRLWSTQKRRFRALPPKPLNPYTFGGAMLPAERVTLRGVHSHPRGG